MSIFTRLGDLLRANINDLIDKAEDPEKMVKQIIQDMDRELVKSTQMLGKAMASERQLEKQMNDAKAKSADWENKAKLALQAGDQELAKKAVEEKLKVDEKVTQFTQMYESVHAQTEQIKAQVEELKSKLEEAKSRQAMLIARSQMADTQKDLAQSLGGMNTSENAFAKMDKMEEKIARKEAEAQAFSEISKTGAAAEKDPFAALESNSKVDAEMARLMAELGGTN
ncbi:MAG: PspA/IM30 family protein [Oscillospiraceae bacterium]|nr:PspA/IM30 family protein [Oscillospiraceae bacterium]MBR6695498.1 PspA/IM30 family protein [Oscillospiraceae bacterium]